jgi:hypothetical protein
MLTNRVLRLLLVALLPIPLAAQGPLRPDQRIRVLVTEHDMQWRTAATIVEVHDDSLLLAVGGTQRSFSRLALSQLEVSAGRGSRGRWSALGALAGTAAGFGVSLLDRIGYNRGAGHRPPPDAHCDQPICSPDPPPPPYPGSRALRFTVGGTLTGSVVGLLLPGERWRPLNTATHSQE